MKKELAPSKIIAGARRVILTLAACSALLSSPVSAAVGTWIPVKNLPPEGIETMLLLPDGTVMAQGGGRNNASINWYRLSPDSTGGYTNGAWSTLQPMQYSRLFYASQVLTNGQVFVAGGEYGTGTTNAEIYDPVGNTWTEAPTTPGAVKFVDAISETLPDGNVLIAPVNPSNTRGTLIWNTASSTWSTGPTLYRYNQSEANWVKLPDQSILTVDALDATFGAPGTNSDRFIPSPPQWIPDANVPVQLWANICGSQVCFVGEAGPALLLPNGNAFYLGGSGATALYTPTGTTSPGNWVAGTSIPGGLTAADTPGAMMVNGKILCIANPTPYLNSTNAIFPAPTSFFEYDYSAGAGGAFTQVNAPAGGTTDNVAGFVCRMLDLPDGTVMFTDGGSQLYVYKPAGSPLTAGQPVIQSVSWNADGTVTLSGTSFNGISEGASYGDDAQMNSNYPLARFTDGSGNVFYGRSYNWNNTGVQTGGQVVSTTVVIPQVMLNQPGVMYSLQVVANGIASNPVSFYCPVWVDFNYTGSLQNGTYTFPYSTLPQGISAVPGGGTIAINAGIQPSTGHVSVPDTISKPMNIVSLYGPSTVSN